jgi:hypothetical protein
MKCCEYNAWCQCYKTFFLRQFARVFVCESNRLFVCLSVCLYVFFISVRVFVNLIACISVHLCVCQTNCRMQLSVHLCVPVYLGCIISPTISLSCFSVRHVTVGLFVCLSLCLFLQSLLQNEWKSAASFCLQVAAWNLDMFFNFYLVKNHKIADNSTTQVREK